MTTKDYKSAAIKLKQFSKDSYEFRKSVGYATYEELRDEYFENVARIFNERMERVIFFGGHVEDNNTSQGFLKRLGV